MIKKIALALVVTLITFSAFAEKVSLLKAAGSSLILPGAGQFYLGDKGKAAVYFAAETAIILSMLRFNHQMDTAIDKYEVYAYEHAGIERGSEKIVYNTAQKFMSSEEYNIQIEMMARAEYPNYNFNEEEHAKYLAFISLASVPEEDSWDWDSKKAWKKYKDLREDKQNYEIYGKFSIAAMCINRIVSTIDASLSARKTNRALSINNLSANPTYSFNNPGLKLNYTIKF